jgi:hypothetical protein
MKMNHRKLLALGFAMIVISSIFVMAACQSVPTAVAFTVTVPPTPSPTLLPPHPRPGYTPLPPDTVPPVVIQRTPERGEELPTG